MFIDQLEIDVSAGNGGNGCVSFRRERYVAMGGPDGGNGGRGGSVWFKVNPALNTLLPLRNLRKYKAPHGKNGGPSNMTGASGEDLVLYVPKGTMIRDAETKTLLADLTAENDAFELAEGGMGGKGNAHFVSSTFQAPKFAQEGQAGESKRVFIELKVMADVGLVGFPNAGKSTFLRAVSAARPKVADYPFTTLEPSLGVVQAGDFDGFVVADIPGIIEGAAEGAGLGLRFIKHIERTASLLFLIDPLDPLYPPEKAYSVLLQELEDANPRLLKKKRRVAFTKVDLDWEPCREAMLPLKKTLDEQQIPWYEISSIKNDGVPQLVHDLYQTVLELRSSQPELEEVKPSAAVVDDVIDPLDELS